MGQRRPKLGQHFLKDEAYCKKIALGLSICENDLVVEIGAGSGALTRLLAPRASRLAAIEIDSNLAARLRDEFSDMANVEILHQDVLEVDFHALLNRLQATCCFVFGNLPYYITSPILQRLFGARAVIRHMTLMMQREVAERVTAFPGSRTYGLLSVLAQCISKPQIVLTIPPGAFSPPPQTYSALVDFHMSARFPEWDIRTHQAFLRFAGYCFRFKRKSLLNNLSSKHSRRRVLGALEAQGLDARVRAEQITIEKLASVFLNLEG